MLVLSRKIGQRVLIGDNISITVVRVGGGAVRLGIDAPEDLSVIREELKKAGSTTGEEKTAKTAS